MSLCQEIVGLLTPISPHIQHSSTELLIQIQLCVFFLFHFSFVQLFHPTAASLVSGYDDDDDNVFSISVDWVFFFTLFQ